MLALQSVLQALALLIAIIALGVSADPRLVKVIVLGRHGNRQSNPEMNAICPLAQKQIKWLRELRWEAPLSRFGEAQCQLAGGFLRKRYGHWLEQSLAPGAKAIRDDHSTFFLAENADRNLVCMDYVKRGLFPVNGQSGHFRNLPMLSTTPGHDSLMNLPKNGPCTERYKQDTDAFGRGAEQAYKKAHLALLEKISAICGFNVLDLTSGEGPFGGKSLAWGLKVMTDTFEFAEFEHMDFTLGGQLSPQDLNELRGISHALVEGMDFGEAHQNTYWVGDFAEKALFANMRRPSSSDTRLKIEVQGVNINRDEHPWQPTPLQWYDHNKFLVFWNHRELITGILNMFGGEYADGSAINHYMPTGSMLLWEVWEDGDEQFIKFFQWQEDFEFDATIPWPHVRNTSDSGEAFVEYFPSWCTVRGRCTLEEFENRYVSCTKKTGHWHDICGYPAASMASEAVHGAVGYASRPGALSPFGCLGLAVLIALSLMVVVPKMFRRAHLVPLSYRGNEEGYGRL